MSFYEDIIKLILTDSIQSKKSLHNKKMKLCKKYGLSHIPSNSEILSYIPHSCSDEDRQKLVRILRKKPMRTISGVAIVAVMTSPKECPHGQCIPCPGGPSYDSPQSYTGFEPAAMRASLHKFDPYNQVKARLEQLVVIGHDVEKIDLIIMGGTFTARSPYYQEWFVKRCYDAFNEHASADISEAKKRNENAVHRCIGLTIETRPDWFRLHHADTALNFGATRVELGVQTVFDDVLYSMKRGHTVSDTINATRIAKESGFKVCYHMMPGLPGSYEKRDKESFEIMFHDEQFKPDMLKIYPTLVIKGTELYDLWQHGKYVPMDTKQATSFCSSVVKTIPEWVRVQRIQRDVPAPYIDAGVLKSNLRQLITLDLHQQGKTFQDIRAREIGHTLLDEQYDLNSLDIQMQKKNYEASGGTEVFLSLITHPLNALVGYLRLRNVVIPHRFELQKHPCMIIRELRVVGREIPVGSKQYEGWQHKGFGSMLLDEAMRICGQEFDKHWLFVLSGIGVKQYYRKYHGFKDEGIYLKKSI
jgi:elongator complex protein 3